MSSVALGLVLAAGLACPVHMWWSHRRGRANACGPAGDDPQQDLATLRRRHQDVSARIAELDTDASRADIEHVS